MFGLLKQAAKLDIAYPDTRQCLNHHSSFSYQCEFTAATISLE